MADSIETTLRKRIAEERAREQKITAEGMYQRVAAGRIARATGTLLYHTSPAEFADKLKDVLAILREAYSEADSGLQKHTLNFLVKLAIDLRSYVPNWALADGLDDAALRGAAETVSATLSSLEGMGGAARAEVLAALRQDTTARLKAEGLSDESEIAGRVDHLLGESLAQYALALAREINNTNLIGVAQARRRGETSTELGNDYAAFLPYVIWQGGSFVTTNPVLIKMAWDVDPAYWNARVEGLIGTQYTSAQLNDLLAGPTESLTAAVTAVNSLVTMAVVMDNCEQLRDIFLLTNGKEGYVSLQVNPKNHDDGAAMVHEAKTLYADLEQSFGGVPNVVFKLPATAGGLYAAEKLTAEGIGVNITVNFSVFQEVGFGAVLSKGHALVSYLALMNGRMSFPVRDDLKAHEVEGGVDAARWAGVEVARKAYHRLYDPESKGGLGIDPQRVKLLIASLRIYNDWIPDISELWGCPVITIFPNVRHTWDSHPREFDGFSVLHETPAADMQVMLKGELFRQAWWMPGDPEACKPARPLTLTPQDAEAVLVWPPVAQTLGQFIDLYDKMGAMVLGRMKHLAGQ